MWWESRPGSIGGAACLPGRGTRICPRRLQWRRGPTSRPLWPSRRWSAGAWKPGGRTSQSILSRPSRKSPRVKRDSRGRLQEYDILLSGTPGELEARLASHHRRRLASGDGRTLRTLSGRDARALLLQVTSVARERASTRRGVTYDEVVLPPVEAFREDPAWGLTTYAVMRGDTPLSAALVGWAGKRAYYVSGGSTPDGYACNASVWLHFQVALAFQSAGFTHYCLGGAPASAVNPSDPSHGLHRFKTGFGGTVRACAGARWVFGGEHEAGHRLTRWIRDHFAGSREIP